MSTVLSVSQIKQIAGRAGRYGLHGNSNPGGIVTTLNVDDMPILREALEAPIDKLTYAGLPRLADDLPRLYNLLPPKSTNLTTLTEIHDHLSRVRAPFKLTMDSGVGYALAALDGYSKDLTLPDLTCWFSAPVSWRDPKSAEVARLFLRAHRDDLVVSLVKCMEKTGYTRTLNEVGATMTSRQTLSNPKVKMVALETMHKALVVYLWMSLRNSVIFPEYLEALEMKDETEKAMEFVLQWLTAGRAHKPPRSSAKAKSEIAYMGKRDFLLDKMRRREEYQKKLEVNTALQ
jgi:ATP-dependent RNA helicase SUPV3L1/SUV3